MTRRMKKRGTLLVLASLLGLGGLFASFAQPSFSPIEEMKAASNDVTISTNSSTLGSVDGAKLDTTVTDSRSQIKTHIVVNPQARTNTTQLRVFKNSSLTISSDDATKVMTKIVFTCEANGTSQYGPGCFTLSSSSDGEYSYDAKIGTWNASNVNVGASTITLTASSNQVRMTKMVITYADVITDPAVSLNEEVLEGSVGEQGTLTASVVNFSSTELTYTWSLDEGGERIVALPAETNAAEITFDYVDAGSTNLNLTVSNADNTETASASCAITVNAAVTGVTVAGESEIVVGNDSRFSATVLPAAAPQELTWSSSNENVAVVDKDGWVFGIGTGTATISATAVNGVAGTLEINVTDPGMKYVYKRVTSADELADGDRIMFASNISNDGWYVAKSSVVSSSYTTAVPATLNGNFITSVNGTEWRYTVEEGKTGALFYDPTSSTPYMSSTHSGSTYRAYPMAEKGTGAYWTVSFKTDGTATVISDAGTRLAATVYGSTYEFAGYSPTSTSSYISNIYIYKRYAGADVDSVSVASSTGETGLYEGETLALSATVSPLSEYTDLTWSSSDASIATVDANGVVTAVKAGEVTITANARNHNVASGSIVLNVLPIYDYELVTEGTGLVLGDHYLVMGKDASGAWYAMSDTLANGAYSAINVEVSSSNVYSYRGSGLSVLTLGAGENGNYALWNENGYIGASDAGLVCDVTRHSMVIQINAEGAFSMAFEGGSSYLGFSAETPSFASIGAAMDIYFFHSLEGDNDGVNAWATSFLADSGAVCSNDKDLDDPVALMGALTIEGLSTPATDILKHATSANAQGDLANALARYDWIVNKYLDCTDVLARRSAASTGAFHNVASSNGNEAFFTILAFSGGLFFLGGFSLVLRRGKKTKSR